MNKSINQLSRECYENSVNKGFWKASDNIPEKLCLIHSEVSEALEELRKPDYNKTAFTEELSDVLIRVFDLAGHMELDLESAVEKKMNKNTKRKYLHGKTF